MTLLIISIKRLASPRRSTGLSRSDHSNPGGPVGVARPAGGTEGARIIVEEPQIFSVGMHRDSLFRSNDAKTEMEIAGIRMSEVSCNVLLPHCRFTF